MKIHRETGNIGRAHANFLILREELFFFYRIHFYEAGHRPTVIHLKHIRTNERALTLIMSLHFVNKYSLINAAT